MDAVRAAGMARELIGQQVGEWLIVDYKGGHGKSAVVFDAEKRGLKSALKVFDPELVERFGKSTQLARIERERSLIGETHPNLVQIYDGGECRSSGYLYVAMELIEASNLATSLNLVPRDKIGILIQQIASAARFLEEKQLAHRDIKPDNIAVYPDFSRVVLLDLGVLRPFGDPGLTDEDQRVFVGTLRYSSPEFLLRTEEDTQQGWRAVSFYQIGAVLHDLIMRKRIFHEFSEPFAMLVQAVKEVKPEIRADDVSPDLILLAQNCLVKRPEARLSLVSWNDFNPRTVELPHADGAKERVKKRILLSRAQPGGSTPRRRTVRQIRDLVARHFDSIIRNECVGNDSFPPVEIIPNTETALQLQAIFPASPAYTLRERLSIRFDCTVVDEPTLALNVAVSACLLPQSASHGDPPTATSVFRGPLDSNNLTARIQEVLWCSVDLAQRQEDAGHLTAARWLNLNQGLEERP